MSQARNMPSTQRCFLQIIVIVGIFFVTIAVIS